MSRAGLIPIPELKNTDNITKNELPATTARFQVIPYKSTREFDERFFVRKRCKTAGILCVFQGFTNEFLAEKIRQNPQSHLRGVALSYI